MLGSSILGNMLILLLLAVVLGDVASVQLGAATCEAGDCISFQGRGAREHREDEQFYSQMDEGIVTEGCETRDARELDLVLLASYCGAEHVAEVSVGDKSVLLSTHDPEKDYVSGVLMQNEGVYHVIEMLKALCLFGMVECSEGKHLVEVGAAMGYLSTIAASLGMTVHAFEPLEANVRRFTESLCLNGRRYCLEKMAGGGHGAPGCCDDEERGWGRFEPGVRVGVHREFVGEEVSRERRRIESMHGNFAATWAGGGVEWSEAPTTSLDEFAREHVPGNIELLILTCQGCELAALRGASGLLLRREIRHIFFRVHGDCHVTWQELREIGAMLVELGYTHQSLRSCRDGDGCDPALIQQIAAAELREVLEGAREEGVHFDILASLPPYEAETVEEPPM